jgi:iron complex outermembrane recepter protein
MAIRNLKSLKKWALTGAALTVIAHGAAFAQDKNSVEFDIDAQELGDALNAFGLQSGKEVFFLEADIDGKHTDGLEGTYSPADAINLLLDDTGIQYRDNDNGTILIGEAYIRQASLEEGASRGGIFRVAQLDQEDDVREIGRNGDVDVEDAESKKDVIVVTGTNIRGAQVSSSPVLSFDKNDILRSGATSTEDFIRTIPQNLDFSANGVGGEAGASAGIGGTSAGVNIRGLDAGATLTLVNGRRLAAGGGDGEFVDISLIPVTAIERVEVLTDGASAIYGADAVAGVVNFILRDDFDGAETRLLIGGVTEGSSQRYQASQTLGKSWGTGNILGSYEFTRRNNLDANDRVFTMDAADPSDLLPQEIKHSVFVSGKQDLSDNVEAFGTFSFSNSSAQRNFTSLATANQDLFFRDVAAQQLGATVGALVELGLSWQSEIAISYGSNTTDVFLNRESQSNISTDTGSDLLTVDLLTTGTLFELPGGDLKLAFGGQFRTEELDRSIELSDNPGVQADGLNLSRDTYAVFAEALVPLVGAENARPGLHKLEITLAGRFEDSSDFGDSINPKFGLSYFPFEALNLRGTYGESFQAPTFSDLGRAQSANALPGFFFPAPGTDPNPAVLLVSGGNANLQPEKASTWTAGFDFEPPTIDGLRISATYFDIDFDDRIAGLSLSTSPFNIFLLPEQFAEVAVFSPDSGTVAEFFAIPQFNNLFGVIESDVGVILDQRLKNVARTKVSGIDFEISYNKPLPIGIFLASFSGNYLTEFSNRPSPSSPENDILGIVFEPVPLRFRTSIGIQGDHLGWVAFLNYVDDYENNQTGTKQPVSSWATIDLSASYDFGDNRTDILRGTRLSINVQNLLNEDPPFVDTNFGSNINFDGVNANPLGRFISVQLIKSW